MNNLRTCEYPRAGHPDRTCDIIGDSILDEYLKQDPDSRVAIEVFGCHGIITIGGEVTSNANINIIDIVRKTYKEIGYDDNIGVQVNIIKQSPEIGNLADTGAGDSGIMTGYATNETPEMLPKEVVIAKRIVDILSKDNRLNPDGKIQVTMDGDEVKIIIMAVQTPYKKLTEKDFPTIKKIFGINPKTKIKVIPFKVGGFEADAGMSGRKIVTYYGPRVPIGGGNFSGKCATKVDRSAAYMARNIAIKTLKKNKLNECFVELAYIIGENQPIMVKINGEESKEFDLSVKNIIETLDLKKPNFKESSLKGHFGYKGCPWEK